MVNVKDLRCLLLHGLGGSPFEVRPVADALIEAGHATVCPVLPGHAATESDYLSSSYSQWLQCARAAYAAQCNLGPVLLGGYSLGGLLALDLALEAAKGLAPQPMAVDANVLIYERIREEIRLGLTPLAAVRAGFDRAAISITDSNLTTIIATVILYQFGTGPIRGFAVTLSLGIIASMDETFLMIAVENLLMLRTFMRDYLHSFDKENKENAGYWPCVCVVADRNNLNFNVDLPKKIGLQWDNLMQVTR